MGSRGDTLTEGAADSDIEAGGDESSMVGQKRSHCDAGSLGDIESCGICLAEVDDQGLLDCCQHAYCFDCIMKWSEVESRCPTCKRRFGRVTRTMLEGAGRRGSLRRPRSFRIPVKDQVFQPSAEDLAAAMEPYANTLCMVCLESDDEHLLLLCDVCDGAAHTYCVGLGRQVPEGDWFCHTCAGADDLATSGSDASVGEEELGDSSDSGDEARHRSQPADSMTDEDSDTKFRLEIQFDPQPAGASVTRRVRQLGSSSSAVEGPQGGAGGSVQRRHAVRRSRNGIQWRRQLPSAPSPDRGRAIGAIERGGRREGQAEDSEAAWWKADGPARTLQAQVQDRLRLRLMRERWPAIRQGTLHFPPHTPPAAPQQAGPPAASKPKDGAGAESERMAWKALRALQSGEGDMLGRERVRGGAGQEARAGAAMHEGAKGMRGRSAPKVPTVAERPGVSSFKGLTRSDSDEARNRIEPRIGSSSAPQKGAQKGMTADEDGAGGHAAMGALAAFAEARRQANAGWVDEEELQGLEEGPSAGGPREGSKAQALSAHGARSCTTPHGNWARRPPTIETAATRRASHDGVVSAGWRACTEAGGLPWSAAGAAGQPNLRREWHSGPARAQSGGSSREQGAQVAHASSGGIALGGSRGRAWHNTRCSPSSLANSRPAWLRPPALPSEKGGRAPGTPPPLWPRSPLVVGAPRPPASLPTSPSPGPTPAVPSTAAAPLAGGPSETPDVGEGARRPSPEVSQAGVREAIKGVVRGAVLPTGTAAPAGGADAAVEVGAHQSVVKRAAGEAGAGDVAEGGHGFEAAKRVKDELAEAVKRQLGPLYKRKVIDRDQFRKAAEGTSRALLRMPSAQALYEELKKGSEGADGCRSALRYWCCQRDFEGPVTLPFCQNCIKRQIDAHLKGLQNQTGI